MKPTAFLTAILAVAVTAGCKGSEDDSEPAFVPKAVAFEGKVDPKYSGTWTSTDQSSVLRMDERGKVGIDSSSTSVNGKSTSHIDGTWLVSDGNLLFQYAEKSGGSTTLKYGAKLSGNTLVLAHGSMTTSYKRK